MTRSPEGSVWTPLPTGGVARAPLVPSGVATPPQATTASVVVPPPSATNAPAASSNVRRQVFGFLPYWELADPSTSLDYSLLSTVAYFSVGIDPDGNLLKRDPGGTLTTGWSGWTSSAMTRVINAAHARGTRVVLTLTLFGWTPANLASEGSFLGDPAARQRAARQAAAAVRDRGADGINLDIEPLAAGHESDFVSFIHELRVALNSVARGYQLTFDTLGRIGNYPIEDALAAGADALFIMGYDYRTASASQAGSIAPLSGPVYDVTDTLLAYLARVPASKVILGVPWYGRAWSTVSSAINADTHGGTKFGPSVSVPYGDTLPLVAKYGRHWDAREQVPWFAYERPNCTSRYGCVTSWRQVYYENSTSLGLKYDLVNRYGIRGAGIWALGYEGTHRELYQELFNKFVRDTTPPEAGIRLLPAEQHDEGFVVDWVARDDLHKVSSFDVQVSVDGGAWQSWLTGTRAGAEVWFGRDGHAYAFRVRGHDAAGNVGAWDSGSVYVGTPALAAGGFGVSVLDGLTVRAAPSTTATRVDTLPIGTVVAITRGPVNAGGYAWYEITEPITEWAPVGLTQTGVWVAAGPVGSAAAYVVPIHAPSSTKVAAGIVGLGFAGAGTASVGPGAAASQRAFSPNGDGSQDTLRLDWTDRVALSAATLNVYRTDGTLLESHGLGPLAAGPATVEWDGAVGGHRVKDGMYVLQIVGRSAGVTYSAPSARPVSSLEVAAYGVTVDTAALPGHVSVSSHLISPNGDGRLDSLSAAGSATGATKWSFTVDLVSTRSGGPGAAVRTLTGVTGRNGKVKVTWDGRSDGGAVLADGTYRVTFRIMDAAGNGPVGRWNVVVDTQAPAVTVGASPALFSPNGDGNADRAVADRTVMAWTSAEGASGILRVLHGGTIVRQWAVAGRPGGRVGWDGRDSTGRLVPDGRYTVEADVRDAAGNEARARATVVVDRTASAASWSASAFDPQDGDALAASARFSFALARSAATSLRIEDAGGTPVRGAWHDRRLAAGTWSWTWDGRGPGGAFVAPGRYVAILTVVSGFGTAEFRLPIVADAFVISLSPSTPSTGKPLLVTITSTEPLRSAPSVSFTQAGHAPSRIVAHSIGSGRYTASFLVAKSGTGAATIVVAGRDRAGGTNRSVARVVVR